MSQTAEARRIRELVQQLAPYRLSVDLCQTDRVEPIQFPFSCSIEYLSRTVLIMQPSERFHTGQPAYHTTEMDTSHTLHAYRKCRLSFCGGTHHFLQGTYSTASRTMTRFSSEGRRMDVSVLVRLNMRTDSLILSYKSGQSSPIDLTSDYFLLPRPLFDCYFEPH